MITLLKLGGSLITDKQQEATFRHTVMVRLAQEIAAASAQDAELRLLIGHGSGSFGHFAAHRHATVNGVFTPTQWRGFAQVARAATELNYLVANELHRVELPIMRFQPSASARIRNGKLVHFAHEPILDAVQFGLIPLVYGDVVFDEQRGGSILSTEMLFTHLAHQLPVSQILLLGETDGVYAADGTIIPVIHARNFHEYESTIGASAGVDVTGGMLSKVTDMLRLVHDKPTLQIRIANGHTPRLLTDLLLRRTSSGTLIQYG
jgi:isopentenyl phosphate kinase